MRMGPKLLVVRTW